jgi:hypothetical protein
MPAYVDLRCTAAVLAAGPLGCNNPPPRMAMGFTSESRLEYLCWPPTLEEKR